MCLSVFRFDSCFSNGLVCLCFFNKGRLLLLFKRLWGSTVRFSRVGSTGRRRMMTATAVAAEEAGPIPFAFGAVQLSLSHTHITISFSLSLGNCVRSQTPVEANNNLGTRRLVFHRSIYACLGLTPFLGRNNKKKKKEEEDREIYPETACASLFFPKRTNKQPFAGEIVACFWLLTWIASHFQ